MRDNENVITKNGGGGFVVSQSKEDTADCKGLREPNFGQDRQKSHTCD